MRLIDLELYKWEWFQLATKRATKEHLTCKYWLESGAFISILPRQSGKTEMLLILADNFDNRNPKEKYFYCIPAHYNIKNARFEKIRKKCCFNGEQFYYGVNHKEYNLLIDDFVYFDRTYLSNVLEHNWKTVTMVGTFA
jgi:hypothetical protein